VFERLEAFTEAAGSEGLVHWTKAETGGTTPVDVDAVATFIRQNQLTAVLPCHLSSMLLLDELVRGGRLSVPHDVSVVSFEQDQAERRYLGMSDADRVVFPLRQMGR
jgi:DNA-binding LacI/PurR family transcriptional regulator